LVDVLPGVLLTAVGVGIGFPTASVAVTAGVEASTQGVAGGLYVTAQQIGIAAGLSTLVAISAFPTRGAAGAVVAGYRLSFVVAAGMTAVAATNVVIMLRSRQATLGGAAVPQRQ
jgi:hypothetical protein